MNAPKQSSTTKLSANDFADFFRDKIATIRQSTVTASLPVIVPRRSVPFQVFDPVTDSEVQSLLAATPATYWPLDPIPTWLLKELAPCTVLHCVSKKRPTFKLSLTLSNLNRFSKFLHCWKVYEICYKSHMTIPTLP